MSNALRLIVVLILVAIIIFALDFYQGGNSPIIQVNASNCASGRSYATPRHADPQHEEASDSTTQTWPRDNGSIYDNQPCFSWPENYKVDRFEVQLSRSRNFSDNESTFTYLVPGICFRPKRPLSTGDWFWRVRAENGWAWSPTWYFVQSAPESADTTGPEISPVSLSITRPKQPLRLKVTDPSGVLTHSLAIRGIKDKSLRIARSAGLVEVRASGGWPKGAHHLRVEASDQLGNQTTKYFWVVVAPAPPKPLQWLSRQGVFNGDACEFPLGIYNVAAKDLAKVKAAGFNLVHHYRWEVSQDKDKLHRYLDAVYEAGLKAFVGFDRGSAKRQGLTKMNLAHMAQCVAEIRDHPALLAWYLFDEPDHEHQYVAPRNLKAMYSLLKRLDPYHPVVVTFAWDKNVKRYGQGCYDVYWIMAYRETEKNDRKIIKNTQVLGPGYPYLAILRAWDSKKSKDLKAGLEVESKNFQPDLTRMRADAYLALTHASSGLCWWWYGDDRYAYVSAGDVPEAWGWLSQVVKEIKQLSPMLSSSSEDLPIQVESVPPGTIARARAIKNGSHITVITVNPSANQETQVTIKSPQFPDQATAKGKFGTPTTEIDGQELSVTLPPLAAHVYEIKP